MSDDTLREKTSKQYRALMHNIRARFEVIDGLKLTDSSEYAELETAAFHLRKSIEGVAFGCLVAMENGLKSVPRDAQGQWNADRIFARVSKQTPLVFPVAVDRKDPPAGVTDTQHHIVTNQASNLSISDVRSIYRRTHVWLHEMNPYVAVTQSKFGSLREVLRNDIVNTWGWLLHHMIASSGEVFLTVMKDQNGKLEVATATANFAKAS